MFSYRTNDICEQLKQGNSDYKYKEEIPELSHSRNKVAGVFIYQHSRVII
jgi:hypothetical protein